MVLGFDKRSEDATRFREGSSMVAAEMPTPTKAKAKKKKPPPPVCMIGCRCCVVCEGLTLFAAKHGRQAAVEERGWLNWIRKTNHNTGLPLEVADEETEAGDTD